MPNMKIILNVDDAPARDLDPAKIIHVTETVTVIRIPRGMQSGKSSVMLRLDLPDGRTVLAETSMALFLTAAQAFAAKEQS